MQHIPKLRVFSLILAVSGLLALLACDIGPITPPGINQDPTANAGADQNVEVGERVSLSGLGSTDPDDDPLTYHWEQRSGPSVTLDDANNAQASFLPVEDGFYEFALTVTDGRGGSDTSSVRIFVGDVDPLTCPRADAGVDQMVNEGGAVTLRGGNSADPSGNPLSYEWFQLSGQQVSINGVFNVEPTLAAPQVTGADIELEFELTVTNEQGCTDTDTVVITVRDRDPSDPCEDVVCEDDGLFCNGVESCSGGVCVSSGDPCSVGETPDEDNEVIDFEALPDGTPTFENQEISNQYEQVFGLTFTMLDGVTGEFVGYPYVVKMGEPQTGFTGCAGADIPLPGQGVGESYLSTGRDPGGANQYDLLIEYSEAVSSASGVLIDLDFQSSWPDPREEWRIIARDPAELEIDSITMRAPDGNTDPTCGCVDCGPGDGLAIGWQFDIPGGQIQSILFHRRTGDTPTPIVFDNFSPATAAAPPSVCDEDNDTCGPSPCLPADCDDGDPCTVDECVVGECRHTAVECPEGQVCNPFTGECEEPRFSGDLKIHLRGPGGTTPLEDRDPVLAFDVGSNIVMDTVRVTFPNGESVTLEPFTDVFSPGVDWITEFRFILNIPGLPIQGEPYTFIALDGAGNPIPGVESMDIWTGVDAPDPPTSVQAELTPQGIHLSWDTVSDIPGSFEPASGIGWYQIHLDTPDQSVYGAAGIDIPEHVIPMTWDDFVPAQDAGQPLSELEDGAYTVVVNVHSVAPEGSGGRGIEFSSQMPGEGTTFSIVGGQVILP